MPLDITLIATTARDEDEKLLIYNLLLQRGVRIKSFNNGMTIRTWYRGGGIHDGMCTFSGDPHWRPGIVVMESDKYIKMLMENDVELTRNPVSRT